jgi:hypothetical protein
MRRRKKGSEMTEKKVGSTGKDREKEAEEEV